MKPLSSRLSLARERLIRRWPMLEPWLQRQGWWLVGGVSVLAIGIFLVSNSIRSAPPPSPVQPAPVAAQAPAPEAPAVQELEPTSGSSTQVAAIADSPPAAAAGAASPSVASPSAPDAGQRQSSTVKVVFKTFPPRRATVMWGGKRLGVIDRGSPLSIERARDSGPLDVVIRSPGYLSVHARAYTFEDSTLEVRLTPVDKKDTLFGYQQPIPEDAGAPPPSLE